MNLLVTETDVRERMSLPSHADISEAVLSALGAAQIRIESALGVTFSRRTDVVDVFHVNVNHYWFSLPDDLAILRLSSGFVDKGSLILRSFRTLEYAMDPTITGDEIDPRWYTMREGDDLKGIIRINARRYDLHYIQATYDAGFVTADDAGIPEWLKEAIITRASAVLTTTSPNNDTPEALNLLVEQQSQISQILAPYARGSVPFAFRPIL